VYARLEKKVGSLWKLSQFNITKVSILCTETVNSFFHLYSCGNPHNRIDDVPLAAGTTLVVDGIVEMYLGYYDWSSPRRLKLSEHELSNVLQVWIYGSCRQRYLYCWAIIVM
jgi:hypothetical protein